VVAYVFVSFSVLTFFNGVRVLKMNILLRSLTIGLLVVAVLLPALSFADIRVEVTRVKPTKTEKIIRQFSNTADFQKWMAGRMDKGCNPYVTEVHIDMNYQESKTAAL
jgi:hypothetical protein